MLRSHRRKAVLTAAALMATTVLLTSCQGDSDGSKKSSGSGASASDSDAKGKSDDGGADGADGTESKTGSNSGGGKSGSKSVSGTWFGTVSYLAPGKYTVTDMKGTEQAFFTSTDTDIQGAGEICGDAEGQAATPCSEEELEAAAKKGVSATVKLFNGTAVSIVEDHAGSGGGDDSDTGNPDGLYTGELGYLAPGKYSLLDSDDGSKITFHTLPATTINGNGWICGEADDEPNKPCTEGELEAAAKKGGVQVIVKIDNGNTVTIDEAHN